MSGAETRTEQLVTGTEQLTSPSAASTLNNATAHEKNRISGDPSETRKLTLHRRPWRRYVTPFEYILHHPYKGSGTEEDPYLIDWLPEDPEDPQRWPKVWKWFQVVLCSLATLAVALSSSAYSGGVQSLLKDFGHSSLFWTAGVSLFVVGFAFGPLLWAPASEVMGRRWIYIGTYAMLTLWQAVTCASQNGGSILVFRALAGFFGSSPLANAGGTLADVLDGKEMGIGMAFFSVAPFLGPALGPITGGFLGDAAGWRWVEGMLAIFCAVITLMLWLWGAETYAPLILRQRADRLSKYTGKVYRYRADAAKPLNVKELFVGALTRPWKFLIFEPIVLLLSIYVAIIYGVLYLNFAAYPIVFMQYRGWNAGQEGLAFLGIMVGAICAVAVVIFWGNPRYLKDVRKRGYPIPEDRLPPAFIASVIIVIGLAGFAATDGPDVHWSASIIFGIPFGMGMVQLFLSILGYLVDCYTVYAASVLAANAVLRSLFGAGFPLFTAAMYKNIGIHWGAAVPGFLALACLPLPFLFYKYGPAIRKKCKYANEAQQIMQQIIAARKEAAGGAPDEEKGARVGGAELERTVSPEHGEDVLDDYPEVMSLERSTSMQNEIHDKRTRSNSLYRVTSGASQASYHGGARVGRVTSPGRAVSPTAQTPIHE